MPLRTLPRRSPLQLGQLDIRKRAIRHELWPPVEDHTRVRKGPQYMLAASTCRRSRSATGRSRRPFDGGDAVHDIVLPIGRLRPSMMWASRQHVLASSPKRFFLVVVESALTTRAELATEPG